MAALSKIHTQAEWSLENLQEVKPAFTTWGANPHNCSCFCLEAAQAEISI